MNNALTWHQKRAMRDAFRARNIPAHILAPDYIQSGQTLCGRKQPKVWLSYSDVNRRHDPANLCCRQCLKVADKAAKTC